MTTVATGKLLECEQIIERGLGTFIEVGTALMEIRDERLYGAEFGTFEDYCQQRWGFSRVRAHHLIEAAETAAVLTMVNTPKLTNERQARAIAPVIKAHGVEVATQVLQEAAELGLTAKSIQQTAERAVATRLRAEAQRQQQAEAATAIESDDDARTELDELIARLTDGEIVVVNLRDPIAVILESRGYLTKIDRNSEWGNPFIVDSDGTRQQVIDKYAQHYLPHKTSLLAKLSSLRGRALGCWCTPQPCHGDVLAQAAR